MTESHCWWAVYRSPLGVDSVAAHYASAFERIGLSEIHAGRAADTAWATAGPTSLGSDFDGWTYAARVVAYQHGDSTHFRTFVSEAPPANAPTVSDSARAVGNSPVAGRHIAFCARLAHLAQVGGTAPREPDGEEKLDVWRRH